MIKGDRLDLRSTLQLNDRIRSSCPIPLSLSSPPTWHSILPHAQLHHRPYQQASRSLRKRPSHSMQPLPRDNKRCVGMFRQTVRCMADVRSLQHVPPGTPVPIVVGSHSKTVRSVAWSCNGQTVASGSDDKNVKIWARVSRRHLTFGIC